MRQKSIAVLAVLALFAGLLVLGTHAFARGGDDNGGGPGMMQPPIGGQTRPDIKKMMPPRGDDNSMMGGDNGTSFGIKPSGEVILQKGKVTASAGISLTVSVMGFSVPFTLDTSIVPSGTSTAASVGDTVDVRGKIDPSTGIITALNVRVQGAQNNSAAQAIRDQIQKLMEQLRKLQIPGFGSGQGQNQGQ